MESEYDNSVRSKKRGLTGVIVICLSIGIVMKLFYATHTLEVFIVNAFYLEIVLTIVTLIVSVIGLVGFIKANHVMCVLFLSLFGLETVYTIFQQFIMTQLVLGKYSFDELKFQLIGSYFTSFLRVLIVLLGVVIVNSNAKERKKKLLES